MRPPMSNRPGQSNSPSSSPLTTTLISNLYDGTSKTGEGMEKYVTQCSDRIMSVVGKWVATENRKALEEALVTALLQAVKLSQTLRCQRAYWSVRHLGDTIHPGPQSGPPNGLFFFNEALMDDKYGEGDMRKAPTLHLARLLRSS